ncbi:MAG: VOC family protein [Iamia sp.]
MPSPIGRLDVAAFDCSDPRELAEFYRSIVGGQIVEHPHGDWFELHTPEGKVAFQRIDDHRRPTWPDGDVPQQAHLDIDVDDLDAGEAAVLTLGARKADAQPSPTDFRVFIDPAGHPFCLVRPWPEQRPV